MERVPPRQDRLATHLLVAAYLALQLALPLPGLLRDKHETRGDFSWNMYAHDYACSIAYTVHGADGALRALDFEAQFRNSMSSSKVLHRDVLPRFHAWLCAERLGPSESLRGLVSCQLDGGPWTDLVDPTADLCAAARIGAD